MDELSPWAEAKNMWRRGERRGKGAGGVFAIRLAETEQSGLCPDDFSARKRANPVLILCHLFRNASISTTRPP